MCLDVTRSGGTDKRSMATLNTQAQQLPRVITSTALLGAPAAVSERQKLLVARDRSSGDVLGFIKSGVKHLFYLVDEPHRASWR
jgi:hypothetical protein